MAKNDPEYTGLVVHGVIKERKRRQVMASGRETEVVTYTVSDSSNHRYYVDDFAPDGYFSVDEVVTIPVYVKPYTRRTGGLGYTLGVQKEFRSSKGEEF